MMMNAASQPHFWAIGGIVIGAMSAPIEEPALKSDVANARSFFGKYSAVTFIAAGKFPASPSARKHRQPRKSQTDTDATESATALPLSSALKASASATPSTSRHVPRPHTACRHAAADQTNIAQR